MPTPSTLQVAAVEFNGKRTHVFDHALVQGRTRKAVLDAKHGMTVRLQGVDAPELHYRPDVNASKAKKQGRCLSRRVNRGRAERHRRGLES